jgi:peptidoglycan hydrolase-like protein with peptidoglycan-binding domain
MHGCLWRAGGAAIVIFLCALPTGAAAVGQMVLFAQDVSDPLPKVDTPAALRANTPEQIRKAQTELRRLECLTGRIDGKLGDQTRQAVKKFWASAKQPAVEVNITDELISQLAGRGDLFCRPVRRFFGFGGRPGGNSARLPLFIPGAGPGPVPATASPPPTDEHKN